MQTTTNEIPCKQCPVFAICQSKEEIFCKLLYGYLCNYDKQGFLNYRKGRPRKDRVFLTNNFFLTSTRYDDWRVTLIEGKTKRTNWMEYNSE